MNTSDVNIADNFFGMIRNLSAETRLDLISRITESLKEPAQKKDYQDSWKSLFGAFESEQSAEEIINDLRDSRRTSRKIEDL
ncbi:MAG: hypothetical protein DRJ05_19330 [Bacteroidetes bacterium]|nr:MAG: hypothetical protein DRJ05_19330 [Bacteroidota bacterium]